MTCSFKRTHTYNYLSRYHWVTVVDRFVCLVNLGDVLLAAMCFWSSRLWQRGLSEGNKTKNGSMVCLHAHMPWVTSHPRSMGFNMMLGHPLQLQQLQLFWEGFFDHSSTSPFVNSDTVALSLSSNSFWRCSPRWRSVVCAGQSCSSTPNSLIYVFMGLPFCTAVQSCWNK